MYIGPEERKTWRELKVVQHDWSVIGERVERDGVGEESTCTLSQIWTVERFQENLPFSEILSHLSKTSHGPLKPITA